jgi:hypothetical protein
MKEQSIFFVSDKENHDIKSLLMSMKASTILLEKKLGENIDESSNGNLNRLKTQLDSLSTILVEILSRRK